MVKTTTKFLLTVSALTLCSGVLHAQTSPCNYLHLRAYKYKKDGKEGIIVGPKVAKLTGDTPSPFMEAHRRRFEYLIQNKAGSLVKYRSYYPDTVKMNAVFCNEISTDRKFMEYVRLLSPREGDTKNAPDPYSQQELMMVGSRFFLCEAKEKNGFTNRICVSLNGVEEIEGERDYTALAAFCFEAIYTTLSQKGATPEFKKHFSEYAQERTRKASGKNSDTYSEDVKIAVYHDMENDESLRTTLMDYYKANKGNVSFQIL